MASIDIRVGNQNFLVKSDVSEEHLGEVAQIVQNKIVDLMQESGMTATKAAVLAAVEFASQMVKDQHQLDNYRGTLLAKASDILEKIERELAPAPH